MIEIRTYGKYKIRYSSGSQAFYAIDGEGQQVVEAKTENEVVEKLRDMEKRAFKRIPIFRVDQDGETGEGDLTSVDLKGSEAWVSMVKSSRTYGSGRSKIYLSDGRDRYYEQTPANIEKVEQIKQKREQIQAILTEITEMRATLEKPINREYFGI